MSKLALLFLASLLCSGAYAQETRNGPTDLRKSHLGREFVDTVTMQDFATADPLPKNASVMIRDFWRGEANVTLNIAEGLGAGEAYTVWVIVFNNPARCIVPYACSDLDFPGNGGDPRVRVSAFQGGTFTPASTGGTFNLNFHRGRTTRATIPGFSDRGCTWLHECELHLVTRTHGPADDAAEQLGSLLGGCDNGMCANTLFAIHRSPNAPD